MTSNDDELVRRIKRDLADSCDEEFKLQREDSCPDELSSQLIKTSSVKHKENRHQHFHVLFRVQPNSSNCRIGWSCRLKAATLPIKTTFQTNYPTTQFACMTPDEHHENYVRQPSSQ